MRIAENIEWVRNKIKRAAERAGRNPHEIELVAVSKRQPVSAINAAIASGQLHFGENYLQEAQEKIVPLNKKDHSLKWHFIGQIQSNKTKTIAELFDLVETIDRFKVASKLNSHLEDLDRTIEVLVQVNIGREPQKGGVEPEKVGELLRQLKQCSRLRLAGLMAMPPYFDNPEEARPYFREMRLLRDKLVKDELFPGRDKVELSMGMSGDFEIAIEEGATLVRVGTAIFGERR